MTGKDHTAGVVPLDDERRKRQLSGDNQWADLEALKNAGEMLSIARQALGLTVEAVAEAIKISPEKVTALEEMDTTRLPDAPFTLGFVNTYAALLELPQQALVDRYRDEAKFVARPAAVTPARKQEDLGSPPQVSLFAVMIVICVLAYISWQIIQSVAPAETSDIPDRYPLAMTPEATVPVVYEEETVLEQSPAALAAEESETPATSAQAAADQPEPVLTEIERLQQSITADDPMVLVPGPRPALRKPTPEERTALREERQRARAQAIAAARARREAEEAAALEAAEEAQAEDSEVASDVVEVSSVASNGGNDEQAVDGGIASPVRTLFVAPVYPVSCEADAGPEEAVTVSYRVSRFGKVVRPTVTASTNSCFDRAALAALARWDFQPARANGRSVASELQSSRIVFTRP